jgi:hypothetical protein
MSVTKYQPQKDAVIITLDSGGNWLVSIECLNESKLNDLEDQAKKILLLLGVA